MLYPLSYVDVDWAWNGAGIANDTPLVGSGEYGFPGVQRAVCSRDRPVGTFHVNGAQVPTHGVQNVIDSEGAI